jgi:trehalose 6-phosphate synthase/phosphatase
VLSEFAGAAEELFSASIVNPYDATAVANAIHLALAMPADERRRRMVAMRERVMSFDARAWARAFVKDLTAPRPAADAAADDDIAPARDRLARALADRRPVSLFLDYDGTLRELVRDPAAARPTPEIVRLLNRLAALANVDLTIISGRSPDDLEAFLGDYHTFGLIAEHGAALRRPRSGKWEQLDRNLSYAWKEPVRKILRLFEASTPGTHIEEKRTSLVWHYRRADPEFGDHKARELAQELSAAAANEPLVVRQGRKIVEVTSAQINKGAAVTFMLAERKYDVVLLAGDDTTDESMFQLGAHDDRELLTVRIGGGPTYARYRLPTPAAFRQFLSAALPSH